MSVSDPTVRITRVVSALSALMALGLFGAYLAFGSQLALAHSADSLMDTAAAIALALAVHVARRPADEGHPAGHRSAEPLAALGVAVLAGVLAVQVAEQAVSALRAQATVQPSMWLALVFALKGAFKAGVMVWTGRSRDASPTPALDALRVDARNDVLLAAVALGGWLGALLGAASLDAWLSLPIAVWIGWSGIELGRENLRLLMGAAPDAARRGELQDLACTVDGVLGVHELRAHYQGTRLTVNLHVVVAEDLSVGQAHEIGEAVRGRLLDEPDVGHCAVHIDITHDDDDHRRKSP